MTKTTFYRFEIDGRLTGLVRRIDNDGGAEFAFVGERDWVDDPSLARYWFDPGDITLVEIERAAAEPVGVFYDVDLDAAARPR